MADDFLAVFMGGVARARVLRLFIFNKGEAFALSTIAKRAAVPIRVVEKEVRYLERSGLIKKSKFMITLQSRRVVATKQKAEAWILDEDFKYASALSKFAHEISPVRHQAILDKLKGSGRLAAIVLSGTFVGDPSRPADLIIAADGLNEDRLERAVRQLEPLYGREIRYAVFSTPEFRYRLTIQDRLIRETLDYPHLVLLDKAALL